MQTAPSELREGRLERIGEGIGKVVYASRHWVVKRERSAGEVVALVVLWRWLRRLGRVMPGEWTKRPSRRLRALRLMVQAGMAVLPKAWWYTTHVREAWITYMRQDKRGEMLERQVLDGKGLTPGRVRFPATRVMVKGWPGFLVVEEATERVETTLDRKVEELAAAGKWGEVEEWLDRLLALRQAGWKEGLFSMDAHLKNFGVIGERVVLLDTGGLTDRWEEVEAKLAREEGVEKPHERLGLGKVLAGAPEVAARFNGKWKGTVNRERVKALWEGWREAS